MAAKGEQSFIAKFGKSITADYRYTLLAALLFAFIDYYIPLAGLIVWLILGLSAAAQTYRESLLLMSIVACLTVLTTYFELYNTNDLDSPMLMPLLLMSVYPAVSVWSGCYLLKHYRSFSLVVEAFALQAMLMIIIIFLLNPDLQYAIVDMVNTMFSQITANSNPESYSLIQGLIANSLIGLNMMYKMVMSTALVFFSTHWALRLTNKKVKVRESLKQVKLSRLFFIACIFAAVCLYMINMLTNYDIDPAWATLCNLAPVIVLATAFGGLAVFYLFLDYSKIKRKQRIIVECLFYFSLYIMPYFLLLLAFFGLLDSGIGLRKKLTR